MKNSLSSELENILGPNGILSAEQVLERPRSYWDTRPMVAKAILLPASTAQVAAIVAKCHSFGQSLVVHGGRTGCVEGTRSSASDVVISLEKMNAIEEIDESGMTMTVQAGCLLEVAQKAAADIELQLPLDLGARGSCMIGGNIATNAGGMSVIRHGMVRAITLGLEVVLPDGTVVSSMNKMIKNNAGFDLKQLFIGSEGALGIVARVVLRLEPLHKSCNSALVALDNFDAVPRLLRHLKGGLGADLCAFEIMWGNYFSAVTEPGYHRAPLDRNYAYYVLCESRGQDPERDPVRFLEVIEETFEKGIIVDAVLPKSEKECQALWRIRDDFDAILKPEPVFLYDVSLPISDMAQYIEDVDEQLKANFSNSILHVLGHVGDGNLHLFVAPGSNAKTARELCDQCVYAPLKRFSGSISAEHGIGFEKKKWLSQSRSEAEITLMQNLKRMIDPKRILNPGVVID